MQTASAACERCSSRRIAVAHSTAKSVFAARALFGIEDAGRWALVRKRRAPEGADIIEHVARTLLRRYGVVFWRLIAREAQWLPPWRDLLRCYRRLEARGEIRGGRFVAGPSGEQFAAPEAIGLLRDMRRREPTGALLSLSGADPLNLVGILSPGARLPALTGNRVLYRDGVPIALAGRGRSAIPRTTRAGSRMGGPQCTAAPPGARNAQVSRLVPSGIRVSSRSSDARSQLAKFAAASYVVCRNSSRVASGDADWRTASYGRMNSCRSLL